MLSFTEKLSELILPALEAVNVYFITSLDFATVPFASGVLVVIFEAFLLRSMHEAVSFTVNDSEQDLHSFKDDCSPGMLGQTSHSCVTVCTPPMLGQTSHSFSFSCTPSLYKQTSH